MSKLYIIKSSTNGSILSIKISNLIQLKIEFKNINLRTKFRITKKKCQRTEREAVSLEGEKREDLEGRLSGVRLLPLRSSIVWQICMGGCMHSDISITFIIAYYIFLFQNHYEIYIQKMF